jgi:uncharacterized Zn-finger protein
MPRKNTTTMPCQYCGTPFVPRRRIAEMRDQRFCSRECGYLAQRRQVEVICPRCGKVFQTRASRANDERGKYCSRSCGVKARMGPRSTRWSGGRQKRKDGYIMLCRPDGRRILEHRLVAEQVLGRPLRSKEHVHHINGTRDDNRPENLRVMSESDHHRLHTCGQWARAHTACRLCGTTERSHAGRGYCTRCHKRIRRTVVGE